MLYAVLFEDNADKAHVRDRHMGDHLAFLERNANTIVAAGPLRAAADGMPAGGLWLVEADDAATVDALTRADPFWPTGLRRSVRVLQWRQVFRDGRRGA
ncbi:MAG TPA: YciI family protein [Vineibacter sp.]|nr:YciI family protein [Vineibacter sp.]